jgi:protein-L-isoaspartate(D-aspartate) O-methyltransferase
MQGMQTGKRTGDCDVSAFGLLLAMLAAWTVLGGASPRAVLGQRADVWERARRKLVEEAIVGAGVTDERVVRSMLQTPRHEFVAPHLRAKAYYDMALPIGASQTISSPFIVAYMTQSLDPQPTDRVLEIGTGSGFQAAVLSPLVKEVYTIEIVESLGRRATRTLRRLGYDNVTVKVGDGFLGWPEHAPFDKIIVTCSPEKVPQPLVEQLKEGGLMVIPAGRRYQQTLYLMRKKNGQLESEALRPTLFVPMTGAAEERRQVRPDPANPRIVNGDFEQEPIRENFVPGWYYQRQLTWETQSESGETNHFVQLANEDPGRPSHLLQGFAIDGRQVAALQIHLRAALESVRTGPTRDDAALVAITFYDENRRELGHDWIGPLRGTRDWHPLTKRVRVPREAKEAILRLGLFGATGRLSFDDVAIESVDR